MRPLRVLFVNENVGGHAAMHAYLRDELLRHPGVQADFLDVPPPRLLRKLVGAPVPGLARLDADLQPLRLQLAASAWLRWRLRRLVQGVDVMHVYTQNVALLSVGVLRDLPTVVSFDSTNFVNAYQLPYRDPGRFTAPSLRLTMQLERRVYRGARRLIAQSGWAARQLSHYGIDASSATVIPFGVPVPPLARRPHAGLPRVTFVGTTLARKGGSQLLRVHAERLRGACVLTLVTRDHVTAQEGVEVVRDVHPGDGRLDAILAETDVFALPTEVDKSPYSVLEAMAAGLPVVTTTVGAIPEMVEDGTSGLLVPPSDDGALATALSELLADPARRVAMGDAARRRVEERFDIRRTTSQLVEVLRGAAGISPSA